MRAERVIAALVIAAAAACGCAHAPPSSHGRDAAPAIVPDSVTTGLWRMDETGGTLVGDAGRLRLMARAGIDTRTDFGRIRGARLFTRSIDSFVYVPYTPMLETPVGITVEAWIYLNAYGQYEDTPVAARWTQQANEQSWMFSVLGLNTQPRYDPNGQLIGVRSPGFHNALIAPEAGVRGKLVFAFQPEDASPQRVYFSTHVIPLGKWVHVAVSFDEALLRFWIDGELDAQFATRGGIRSSRTGLVIGNYIDPRWLTDIGGDLRVTGSPDAYPYYAFEGFIDELRISSEARPEFGYAKGGAGR